MITSGNVSPELPDDRQRPLIRRVVHIAALDADKIR